MSDIDVPEPPKFEMTALHRLVFIFLSIVLSPYLANAEDTSFYGLSMGTSYSVTLPHKLDPTTRQALTTKIQVLLKKFSQEFSTYEARSTISRFNQIRSTATFPVSERFAKLAGVAAELASQTNGAFDPTVEPLSDIWGFDRVGGRRSAPTQAEIDLVLTRVGMDKLIVTNNPPALAKTIPQLHVDLSAIAKGFGVDEVGRLLEAEEYANYIVEIGGEIRARGRNSKGDFWRVGIAVPNSTANDLNAIVGLVNTSIATSGDYQKYIEIEGIRQTHIIDPQTGRPISHNLASATVLHVECAHADAYATALMVVGTDRAKELSRDLNLPVLLISREGRKLVTWTSKNWPTDGKN